MLDYSKRREAITELRKMSHAGPWYVYPNDVELFELAARIIEGTLPITKTVEVWHVDCSFHGTPVTWTYVDKMTADRQARDAEGVGYRCVCVTGPYKHEVPA